MMWAAITAGVAALFCLFHLASLFYIDYETLYGYPDARAGRFKAKLIPAWRRWRGLAMIVFTLLPLPLLMVVYLVLSRVWRRAGFTREPGAHGSWRAVD